MRQIPHIIATRAVQFMISAPHGLRMHAVVRGQGLDRQSKIRKGQQDVVTTPQARIQGRQRLRIELSGRPHSRQRGQSGDLFLKIFDLTFVRSDCALGWERCGEL